MNLRGLPSVEQLLQTQMASELIASYGRPLTLQAIRSTLDEVRRLVSKSSEATLPDREILLTQAASLLHLWTAPTLLPVINASGVILHTNLGRAPLSTAAIQSMDAVSRGYSNLEFNLETGKRGSRLIHAETLLQRLTGAEAAVVVNNNAAAVLLVLSALANKKRVIVSRSQLVEIGGGFRIPDVMRQSGAKLVEVGATNRVHLSDYEEALSEPTALVMHAHHSNFKMIGFTKEPERKEIADLAHKFGVIFADDLGSGTLLATERYGLAHEPTVQESLAAGADLVCFSGDKLLGGPQAGILIGKADLLARIKKHPLARAVRADKLCLAALTATLLHYIKAEAEREIPIWRMISASPKQVKARAEYWAAELGQGEILASESTVGGGSLPGESLPTWVLSLTVKSSDKFLEKLRQEQPPVIARTENDRILLDPRTVLPEQDGVLLVNLANVLQSQKRKRNP
ncbi:MAG: L-seryl-tRNA(Sec) selenium transferase [Chloroflexi bacterium]|nr:L-seryl-tRNA(Sec) selenium transferase [Chloroflexota bacterium]